MWRYIIVFSLLGLLDLSSAQIVQLGQCNENIQLAEDFNITTFTGTWYGIATTDSPLGMGDCSTLQLTPAAAGYTVLVQSVNSNFREEVSGTATLEAGTSRFTFRVSGVASPVNFWVLATDNINYALSYSCVNQNATHRAVYIWQLGRATQYPTELMPVLMNTTLQSLLGLTLDDLRPIAHTDKACHVLPDIPPGQDIILPGQCPTVNAVQNFDASRFSGVWHGIASYYTINQRGTCGRARYTLDGNIVQVENSEVIDQTLRVIRGTAFVDSNDGSARLNVSLEVMPGVLSNAELFVLATDYTSYAVSYACINQPNNQRKVNAWIIGRTRRLTEAAQRAVDAVIDSNLDLNNRFFVPSDQSDENCFYFPEPVPGRPVVFRGQCNQTVQALPNFDASRYMGRWHTIEAYPSVWESGNCNTAEYSLGEGGVVDVYNTQVINQALAEMRGFARVTSTDGSAKLDVTFPAVGTNQNVTIGYWVLDTDYVSYSLVYTCQNSGPDDMQVWSWKLSRTRALTPAAVSAIDRTIATVQVLDSRYYVTRNQTDEACFYFPEPRPGVVVEFPGRCDATVPVVQNFNLQSFAGTWYEIQAYPKEQQTGQCISHSYTVANATQLNLVSSSITDQFLGRTEGSLSIGSTDGSARLTLNLRTSAGDVSFPFWILAVNYTDYALAYSCVDVSADRRRIFSWKLSRTQGQLSTAANNDINSVIATNLVLDQRYYEDVSHSAEACFALPDLPLGVPIVIPGQCDPNVPVFQNFDAVRYSGLWRLIESYYAEFQSGDCNEATYTLNGTSVIVFNTHVINQTLNTITGEAVLASTDGSARLNVTFPGRPGVSDYWVLDTDYVSYALVYSCVNLNQQERRVWSWKLSRTNELTEQAQTNINRIVNSVQVLNNRFYEKVNRTDEACFYFPEPNPDVSVVFRGSCDESIPVVTNFDAVRYMNLWHDIESYPTVFQGGTCNNAFYTLNGSVVDILNSQVINQTLNTMRGVATVASNDTSAKLTVSFPIAGTNLTTSTPYWVLGTDYTSYALVYTCVNLEGNQRRVYSWKLSRTKQLTTAANNAITAIISTIPVLQQQYYIQRQQTPEACFYFPEPVPGVPVEFPGTCDNNIQAVANFNLTQFEGIWYEIEAYPKLQQPGQCVNHEYTRGTGNDFSLVSSSVSNLTLDITRSTAVLTSTDGSGRLTITIQTPNGTETIPFWILATDYTSYALAYSCVPTRTDFRGVYSWKLSRTKSLTSAANVAINNAMQNINVLDNRYFEDIDQSDEACFFLPERVPGQAIVFPGQCDSTIPVVQNFNATRYAGRWRLIESYPTAFQNGTCQEATYTLNDSGVIVFNTQVLNGRLNTITGSAVLATTDGSAKLLVTFPNSVVPADYWVLDTDYDSYALVYGCRNISTTQRLVTSWKLSRTRDLTPVAIQNINRIVDSINVLDQRYFDIMDQSDAGCFYFPQPDPSVTVTFRGQCDPNIPVVTNFAVNRYMGVWYDIESYPSRFQQGTCNTASYTLVGEQIDVRRTQVTNQTLASMSAIARVTSTDNSAKLEIIRGANRVVNYWVLDTDYDNYALVYNCINITTEERQVWSWILSRQRTLTPASRNAVNNVIQNIPVLDSQYYIQRNHTTEGCFYFPAPVPGVPVEFPGQCDNSIQAVANFSLQSFIGLWHEIEAYPKDQQTGQCVNHLYSQGPGNTLNLVSTGVQNLTLNTTNSNVAITSTDGSGRLSIVLNQNGNTITIPFWVLDTDYSSYALAYSCVNSGTERRRVFSWKLSRTRQLTAAANVTINNKIDEIDVLDQRYYENIDQSDEACFYLPNLGPNDPVVFRGQCDQNIPVVTNFNASRYAGRWRMIETYTPDPPQGGACNEAQYTLLPNSTVLVRNSQVNNQSLQSIEGTAVVASTDGSARLLVTFPGTPEPAQLWVLATDYDSYALAYSCRNLNNEQRRVWSWKLSRTTELSPAAVTSIDRVVNSINVLDNRYYQRVNQSDEACFYYPTPDGRPVTFRGQCDESIPVVMNFDAQRYMGRWYDIQSYPQFFQDGTCPTAVYTLTNAGVDVFNTQVVGQQLNGMRGLAVPATNDGSAKLTVTFPVGTTVTNTPYWVLATDYTTYSLVYSCSNIDAESRRVTSWQLSRTRNLTANAVEAINRVIESVPVLRQDYYTARGHSDEDCFFYPDNEGGPVILDGQCAENQSVVTNFSAASFGGIWYEISRFPSELQNGGCAQTTLNPSGSNAFSVRKSFVYNERLVEVTGIATAAADGRGILTARFNTPGGVIEQTLHILSTDNTDHALLFSCANLPNNKKQIYSWKLARSQTGFSAASNATINRIVSDNLDLFEGYYEPTDQSNDGCFYYPEFSEPPPSIILPGPCDTRIRGKANFSAEAYLGRWFEIANYPQAFQNGECSRAEYILAGDAVRVVNSQVVNRTLDIMIGSAVVASTDGSGVLNVSFAFDNGVVNFAEYFILDTDYNNFALVYSCRNLDNNRRQVSSWKLSRSRTLSNEANAIINRIINETQGLRQEYYTPTRQDEDACFYIPELNRNEAPRFRGQCGNVTGVQNFDAQRYVGWWHEIERYPSDATVGECISADFRAFGDAFQIVDTNVFGDSAVVSTSTVTVSNDGRLRKRYDNGTEVDIWVLATDYNTYSLLYTCENIDSEYMRVWSAKHSKARSLTDAAQAAMAAVIQDNRVLESSFYLAVNQSDEACFHYPEQTGPRIILPGQCDPNIPVQQNFDAGLYTGTWFQIQRYPQRFERGNCTAARYTLNDNGVIAVRNWQVIDGQLDVIDGTANVTSTDRSARLRVFLPVRGTNETNPPMSQMDLWILTTDYTTYSLVYSCENLDQFRRAVGAWKLSRARTMSEAGNAAINNYMATRPQELHQPYFIDVGQSDDCPEPSSAILVKSSIIVMLVCAMLQLYL